MSFDLEMLKKLMKPIEGSGADRSGRLNEQKQLEELLKDRENLLRQPKTPRTILHPR